MLILLLAGILLAWFLQNYLYSRYWSKNLSVRIDFQEPYVYEGDISRMKEVLINDKLLPLPSLEVQLAMSRNLRFLDEASENTNITDQTYKRDVFSFLSRQQITRTLLFEARKRGYYQITNSDVIGTDFLLLTDYHRKMPQSTALYVYPAQVDVSRIRLITSALSGEILAHNRIYQDPFEFSGIREYRKEDPMNRINWKASARNQKLMVNQFDATTNIEVTILLDTEDQYILKHTSLVEESIRIASSLAAQLVKGKMDFLVCANAIDPDTGEALSMEFCGAAAYPGRLNQKLARLDPDLLAWEAADFIRREAEAGRSGHTYVVISKNVTEAVQEALLALRGTDNRILLVVPYEFYAECPKLQLSHITPIFWEVKS